MLVDEEKLSLDLNHDHNLIALCEPCHTQFDKPRTVEEYRKMTTLKKSLIRKDEQQALWERYPLEEDIRHVIDNLYSKAFDSSTPLSLLPLEIDRTEKN